MQILQMKPFLSPKFSSGKQEFGVSFAVYVQKKTGHPKTAHLFMVSIRDCRE
jgi:hypothetical protein